MADYYEIDFLAVETAKSGDAIAIRYDVGGVTSRHVVDGGFTETGPRLVEHIRTHFAQCTKIEHVVVTHPDGDHCRGLKDILESFTVDNLWMLRPWSYASELIQSFKNYESVDALIRKLKELYPNIKMLEDVATQQGVAIREPFQGANVGVFKVLAPSKERYLQLILDSERTPEVISEDRSSDSSLANFFKAAANLVLRAWGVETFSSNPTSRENEMSVIQYAEICGKKILLTGDGGREALREAIDYLKNQGVNLPGLDLFQIPHHGSRRNLSSEILDELIGPKLAQGETIATCAVVSSAKADQDHPRKSVIRALMHRGANVYATEGKTINHSSGIQRNGWSPTPSLGYPAEEEE